MHVALPLTGEPVNVVTVALLGLLIGALAGLVGVGGGFLLTPMLNVLFRIPYNVAVGSSLCQMVGLSASATLRHTRLGNVDTRLALLIMPAAAVGVEGGACLLDWLKQAGAITINGRGIETISLVMNAAFIVLPSLIGVYMLREAWRARTRDPGAPDAAEPDTTWSRHLQQVRLPPFVSLPASAIERISIWIILGLAAGVGFMSGLLGVGGGFIMMPAMIYLLGVPTRVAVGTDLLQVIFASTVGTLTHSLKGNVDLVLASALLVGSTVGSQIGASLTTKIGAPRVRIVFAITTFVAAIAVAFKLLALLGIL